MRLLLALSLFLLKISAQSAHYKGTYRGSRAYRSRGSNADGMLGQAVKLSRPVPIKFYRLLNSTTREYEQQTIYSECDPALYNVNGPRPWCTDRVLVNHGNGLYDYNFTNFDFPYGTYRWPNLQPEIMFIPFYTTPTYKSEDFTEAFDWVEIGNGPTVIVWAFHHRNHVNAFLAAVAVALENLGAIDKYTVILESRKEYKDVKVRNGNSRLTEKISFVTGRPADLFQLETGWTGEDVILDYAQDIESYINQYLIDYGVDIFGQLSPDLVRPIFAADKIKMLPMFAWTERPVFNRTLWEAEGLKLPPPYADWGVKNRDYTLEVWRNQIQTLKNKYPNYYSSVIEWDYEVQDRFMAMYTLPARLLNRDASSGVCFMERSDFKSHWESSIGYFIKNNIIEIADLTTTKAQDPLDEYPIVQTFYSKYKGQNMITWGHNVVETAPHGYAYLPPGNRWSAVLIYSLLGKESQNPADAVYIAIAASQVPIALTSAAQQPVWKAVQAFPRSIFDVNLFKDMSIVLLGFPRTDKTASRLQGKAYGVLLHEYYGKNSSWEVASSRACRVMNFDFAPVCGVDNQELAELKCRADGKADVVPQWKARYNYTCRATAASVLSPPVTGAYQCHVNYKTTSGQALFSIAIIMLVFTICVAAAVFIYRNKAVIKASSWVMTMFGTSGIALIFISTIVSTAGDTIVPMCGAPDFLLAIGIGMLFSTFMVKLWTVKQVFAMDNSLLRNVQEQQFIRLGWLMSIELILAIIYISIGYGSETSSVAVGPFQVPVYKCTTNQTVGLLLVLYNVLLLAGAFTIGFVVRDVPSQYNESQFISNTVAIIGLSGLIMFFVSTIQDTTTAFLLKHSVILFTTTVSLFTYVVSKFFAKEVDLQKIVKQHIFEKTHQSSTVDKTGSKIATGSGGGGAKNESASVEMLSAKSMDQSLSAL